MEPLLPFYRAHVENVLLPFWYRALDSERGGIYTCFNNAGTELVSTDKYTWSQGRFVWILSQAAAMMRRGSLAGDADFCLDHARRTAEFLRRHVFLDNGNCAYVLTADGDKKEAIPGLGYDISFFADCFVVSGFAKYASVSADRAALADALRLYRRIRERLANGDARSEPYPVPDGFEAQSTPMILLNVAQELADTLAAHGHPEAAAVRAEASGYMDSIMDRFRDGRLLREMLPADPRDADTLLCRHITPGHAVECMWFVMAEAAKTGRADRIEQAADVIERSFELGWDAEYGGLFREVDRDGGAPKGRLIGGRYEALIVDTWDMKIWWPHSEILYSLLLAHSLTGRSSLLDKYRTAHDYVFRTFPNPDAAVGEWIQIRDRSGKPVDKTVALPVKDPYHILRNMLLAIELLDGLKKES
ncbi:N-acylglucosamine 2-epimerase [Gordoniibacillus kamchatkensis]|uniref:N-acylglucosamine 2-epimerase n=1 Tax=Gordoniibacillus kamchatkensis TaxID=1590651 RepID=A0ABR5AKI9_9BACL|nr:AGE family epimerase/isomerase [Paenibacillus sp. VKM B-2647]KIL41363.1 N-acylglucosamine 2-epimerase [Paenibacillus sp. VKM B-2647]